MQNLFLYIFLIVLSSASEKTDEVIVENVGGNSINYELYAPLEPKYFPVKYVNVVIHVFRKNDGSGSFPENEETKNWLINNYLGNANFVMAHLYPMRLESQSAYIEDSRIKYKLLALYFHNDSLGWDMSPKAGANIFSWTLGNELYQKYVINNPTNAGGENAVHIFLGENLKGKGMASGIGDKRWVIHAGVYEFYKEGNFWTPSGGLRHELAHSLGLIHTWNSNDGCDDTPLNSGCWNGDDCSNNMLDYNASKGALTVCQLGRAHYYLSGKAGNIYDAVEKDFCRKENDNFNIEIAENDTVVLSAIHFLKGNIHILKNAQLIVTGEVSIPENAEIMIEDEGKLVVDGGKIFNACGLNWSGITGIGSRNVELKNGGSLQNLQSDK